MKMQPTGSLAQLLAWRVAERPGHPCVWVEGEGPWTVGQLAAAAVAHRAPRSMPWAWSRAVG